MRVPRHGLVRKVVERRPVAVHRVGAPGVPGGQHAGSRRVRFESQLEHAVEVHLLVRQPETAVLAPAHPRLHLEHSPHARSTVF